MFHLIASFFLQVNYRISVVWKSIVPLYKYREGLSAVVIPKELIKMNAYLPVKLAELAVDKPEIALGILIAWGEGTKPLRVLWVEVNEALEVLSA